jgi:hypothetical protein
MMAAQRMLLEDSDAEEQEEGAARSGACGLCRTCHTTHRMHAPAAMHGKAKPGST